jgi:hypothetical protein
MVLEIQVQTLSLHGLDSTRGNLICIIKAQRMFANSNRQYYSSGIEKIHEGMEEFDLRG